MYLDLAGETDRDAEATGDAVFVLLEKVTSLSANPGLKETIPVRFALKKVLWASAWS
jgi:hypothetical protein